MLHYAAPLPEEAQATLMPWLDRRLLCRSIDSPQPLHPSTFTRLEVKLQVVHAVDHKPWHELDPSTRISLISASVLSAAVFRYQVLQAARDMGLERYDFSFASLPAS